jgi:hypothetical protein
MKPLLCCHPNDSTHKCAGETAALRDFKSLYAR